MEYSAMLFCLLLPAISWSFSAGNPSATDGGRCNIKGKRNNTVDLTIFSTRNKTGNWTTSFIADQGIQSSINGVLLALQRSVIECEGTQVLRTAGLLQEFEGEGHRHILQPIYGAQVAELRKEERESETTRRDILKFDSVNKGKKAVISKDGRTAYRTTPKENDMEEVPLITNRVLREEEMFQVRVDETIEERYNDWLAFGLSTDIPEDINTTCHISKSNGTWVVRENIIRKDDNAIKKNYPLDTRKVQLGTIVGVMRKKNGDLHFYKDGQDMGLAATNLPPKMYGIFDLRDQVTKISIVD